MVVAHYLGVPKADRAQFDTWSQAIVAASALGDPLGASNAVGQLFAYFSDLIEKRRSNPGEDTISQMATTGEETVTVLQALGFAFTMVVGGNDTTTGLLGGAAELLTARPDQRAVLIADPGAIPIAVEELLRLTSPVQGLARTVVADVEIEGTTIPGGRKVMLMYAAANRDPRQFGDDAGELNVTRAPRPILSFGYGPHHCLGAAAARLQAKVALEELLARCPDFSVDAERGTFAPGNFVRRYLSLPFEAGGLA
jgi:cytochrome P450